MKKFIWILLFLFSGIVSAVTPPTLPFTPPSPYDGYTYSQAIRYYSASGGEHTCYFEDGAIVAGYLPGYFWISNSRRYDPDGICGGTYESPGQLAVNLGEINVDCPANQHIFSSIPLTVPSGWGLFYQQCNYTYGIGDPFPAPAQAIANVILSPAVGGVATLPQGDGIWCGIDGQYICQVSFDQNSEITFEAYPHGEYTFAYWSDGVNQITENPHTFTMDESKTITAVFETENSSLIVPPSLPFVYSGIIFNSAFAWIDTNDVYHVCYFKDPVLNSITYWAGYIGVNNQARYALNGSDCGGTYLSPGGGVITFDSNGFKTPIANNVYWSGETLYTKSWWSYPWTLGSYEFTEAGQQIYPFPTSFSFPIQINDPNGNPYTAYTAPVSSVMDHSTLGSGATYSAGRNGSIVAFSGETGSAATGCYCYSTSSACDSNNYSSCSVPGYMRVGGGSWNLGGINYTGNFLYYDGHPGYDYPFTQGTYINAPEAGTLCVATTHTTVQSSTDVWRNTSQCPLPNVVTERWLDTGGFNAFYIFHPGLYINGSTDDYLTVFLHSDNLESSVRTTVETNGYATVRRNQHIAQVGDKGAPGAYHMHLEVYKKNVSGGWDRVDPYGNDTNDILWPH